MLFMFKWKTGDCITWRGNLKQNSFPNIYTEYTYIHTYTYIYILYIIYINMNICNR